jgi:hypothetical protein
MNRSVFTFRRRRGAGELEYFALPWTWRCKQVYVSTWPSEVFIGSGASSDYSGGNITLAHNQDVCFFQISDALTTITGRYVTEAGFDILYVASADWSQPTAFYSDSGTFSETRSAFAGVRWHSDESRRSGGFAVTFKSALSALSRRRAGVSGSADRPQLLVNGAAAPDDPTSGADPYPGWGDRDTSSAAIAIGLSVGVPIFVVMIIIAVFVAVAKRRARRRMRQREALAVVEGVPAPEPYGAANVAWGNGNQQEPNAEPPQIAVRGAWPVDTAYGVLMYPAITAYLGAPLADGNVRTPDVL